MTHPNIFPEHSHYEPTAEMNTITRELAEAMATSDEASHPGYDDKVVALSKALGAAAFRVRHPAVAQEHDDHFTNPQTA